MRKTKNQAMNDPKIPIRMLARIEEAVGKEK
jgi:hypothetical protein